MSETATPTAAPAVEPTAPITTSKAPAAPVTEPQQSKQEPTSPQAKTPAEPTSLLDDPKPTEPAKEQGKEPAKPTEGAPEKYEPWKLGDSELPPELSDPFSELAKAANLPQAKAQEYLERLSAGLEQQNQQNLASWIEKAAADTKAADGDQFDANRAMVSRAVNAYGDADLQALLKTPLGKLMTNTKAMWGFLKRVGADVSDAAVVTGRTSAPAAGTADDFYREITPK